MIGDDNGQNRAKLDGDLEAGACLAGEAQKLRCKNEVAGRRHRQKLGQPLQEPQEEDRQQRWLHRQSARGELSTLNRPCLRYCTSHSGALVSSSEERRAGNECVSKCGVRWVPKHEKIKQTK